MLSLINQQFIKAAKNNQLDELKNLLSQGADIHADIDAALKDSAQYGHYDVWQVLSAFIQEEKLLVAASVSMPLVAASDSMLVLPGASSWVYGTALESVALVAPVSVVTQAQPLAKTITKTKRLKI